MTLRQLPPGKDALPTDVGVFTIAADGFASEEEAWRFGRALKRALALYSVRHKFGFSVGTDQATLWISDDVRESVRNKTGFDLRPIVHGLDVFDSAIPFGYFEDHGRVSVLKPIKDLPRDLAADFPCRELPDKLTLAIELFNALAYETDSEVRFLALITVVEAMAVRPLQGPCVEDFLDTCINALAQSALTREDRESLKSSLGNLRSQSISRSCANLVNEAGADAALFKKAYKARSELLHDGISRTYPDLPRQPHLLEELVQRVVLHQVACATADATPVAVADRVTRRAAFWQRVRTRAYFLWENRTGMRWHDAESNWQEALKLECTEWRHD